MPGVGPGQPRASWALKSAGEVNERPGRKLRSPDSRWPARPGPWLRGRAGGTGCTRMPSVPRNASNSVGQLRPAAAPGADRGLVVPHQRPRAPRPARRSSCQCPPSRSGACRDGIIRAHDHPRVARRPSPAPAAAPPARPQRDVDRREPQIALRQLARPILGARGRIRRHEQRPQLRAPGPSAPSATASQPIRSAITVAGIVGNSRQQRPDLRLDRVHHRPPRRPLIPRRRHRPPTPDAPCSATPRAAARSP